MTRNNFEATLARAAELMNSPLFNMKVEGNADAYAGARFPDRKRKSAKSLHEEIESFKSDGTMNMIRESFEQQPTPVFNDNGATSVLNEVAARKAPQVQVHQTYAPQPAINTGIDYNALKFIINECIRENLQQIRQTLNEGQVKTIGIMGNGDKIQFVDKEGNLYEGTIAFKKNVRKTK